MADNVDEKITNEAAVEEQPQAEEQQADASPVENEEPKGKKKKSGKDAAAPAANWRSKEKEKPLFLDKHKVLFWVLVGVAVLGLVMAIIPFVVKGGGGDTDEPWSIYVSRLSAEGYTVSVAAPDSEELTTMNAQLAQMGVPNAKWVVYGTKGAEAEGNNVQIVATTSEEEAARIVALYPALAASEGNLVLMGATDAISVALGRTFVPGTINPFLNANFGREYVNNVKNYVFERYPNPAGVYYFDNAITNMWESDPDGTSVATQQESLDDLLTNNGDPAYTSPGNADMIFVVSAQNADGSATTVYVVRYSSEAAANTAKANIIASFATLAGVETKGNFVILVASTTTGIEPQALASALLVYLP